MDVSRFYKLSIEERLKRIKEFAKLSADEVEILKNTGALSFNIADRMIENVVGAIHLPLGIATNFKINGKEYLIPMAIEEPSVVAAACKAAKLTLPEGFIAEADEPVMIGQLQIINPKRGALERLTEKKRDLLEAAKKHTEGLEKYGGGVKDVSFREIITKRGKMLIVEFDVNVADAMGANTVNTLLEKIAPYVVEITGGEHRLKILTNLAVKRKVRAEAEWKNEVIGADAVEKILDGYEMAVNDVYRCTTHNKGIMNGIDAVAVATGQDWRAIEAGAHAYASLGGYKPLTAFEKTKNGIKGRIELPLAVGTVGGAVNTVPTAKIALKILGAGSAKELAMAMACVGLANNFAALYALATTGIQAGHMKLHARNIAILAGASTPAEIDAVASEMAEKKNYSVDFAKSVLERVRR